MLKFIYQLCSPKSTHRKELYQRIDDDIEVTVYRVGFGTFCFSALFFLAIGVLYLLKINVPILFNIQLHLLVWICTLLTSLIKKTFAPAVSLMFALISATVLIYSIPNLVFGHQYSFITGFTIVFCLKVNMYSLGKYMDIVCLAFGLVFCYCSYNGEDIILLCFLAGALVFYCTLHIKNGWNQRKLIESANTFAIYAENELKSKELMEKLFYKPSFMTSSQMDTLHFCSLTYNTVFNMDWNELLEATSIMQIQEFGQFLKAQSIIEHPLTLLQYIRQQTNITEIKSPIILIGFVPVEQVINIDTKACTLLAQHNFVPFQIKIFIVTIAEEFKLFIEYDAKAVDEVLVAKSLERYKDSIMSSVSHDLKTPISASIGNCAQMKPYNKLELIKSAVKEVDQQIHKAHFNLSLMMLNAKAVKDADGSTPNISCFGAHRLVRSLCKVLNIEALGKCICLNICSDERFTIFNDKEAFLYVNYILISNAITHTHNGCVNVMLTPILPIHNNGVRLVEVTIEDEGVGMEPNIVKQIEENNFFDVGNNNSLQGGYLGISNAIKLLKKISPPDSRLKVQSTKGKGTTFSYQIYHRHPAGKYHEKNQRDDIAPEDPSDDDALTTNLFMLSHIRRNEEKPQTEDSNIDPSNKEIAMKKEENEINTSDSKLNDLNKNKSQDEGHSQVSDESNLKQVSTQIPNNNKGGLKSNEAKKKEIKSGNTSKPNQINILSKIISPTYLCGFEYKLPRISITKEEYESLHIVVVDDCFFNCESIYLMLRTFGLQKVFKTVSSSVALVYLQNNPRIVDMIFTDYQMPELNGYELVYKATEQNLLQKSCMNVLVTAACEITIESFDNKVFHSVIKKPFQHQQVLNEVLEFLIANRRSKN